MTDVNLELGGEGLINQKQIDQLRRDRLSTFKVLEKENIGNPKDKMT